MNKKLKNTFNTEIKLAKNRIEKGEFEVAFAHLERAHVISQKFVLPHTISHLYMLKVALIENDFKEIFGQVLRIPLGILGSLFGIVPVGNTGGSNVSAFKKMKIPPELKEIMDTGDSC